MDGADGQEFQLREAIGAWALLPRRASGAGLTSCTYTSLSLSSYLPLRLGSQGQQITRLAFPRVLVRRARTVLLIIICRPAGLDLRLAVAAGRRAVQQSGRDA